MKFFYVSFLILALCSGCQYESLNVINPADQTSGVAEFNFNVESISRDTIAVGEHAVYNLYIRQQNIYIKGKTYYITYSISNNVDANAKILGNFYKSGDLIPIPYDSIVNSNYRASMLYFPHPSLSVGYSINFTCTDQAGNSKTFVKNIVIN